VNHRKWFFVVVMISIIFAITTQVCSAEDSGTTRAPAGVKQPAPEAKKGSLPQSQHNIKLPLAGEKKPVFPDRPELSIVVVRIMANENLGFWPGQLMPIAATVINSGQITSPPFSVKFVVRAGPESQNPPVYITTVSMNPLSPNKMNTANYTVTLTNAVPGQGDIEVIVDPQNEVPENNEGNNSWHKMFFIQNP